MMVGISAFGVVLVSACVALAVVEYRKTGEIVSPLIVFLGLAILDVYLPAVAFAATGVPPIAPWLDRPAVLAAMPAALLVFTAGLGLFLLGYVAAHRLPRPAPPKLVSQVTLGRSQQVWAIVALAGAVGWYGWTIAYRAASTGSLAAYVLSGLVIRWRAEPLTAQFPSAAYPVVLALQIGDVLLPVIIMSIAIILAARSLHPALRLIVFPLIGLLVSLTTFFRGTPLSYFVALAAIAELRTSTAGQRWFARHAPALLLVFAGVMLFLGYGVIRNTAVLAAQHEAEAASGTVAPTAAPIIRLPGVPGTSGAPAVSPDVVPVVTQEALSYEAGRVLRGEGLVGLSSIVAYYPSELSYLGGTTIRDMLLLPIPRSIWRDKPSWYGIAQITRGMGEPSSTQSAVTIPGELYANFGPLGVLGTFVFGLFFGYFHRMRHGRRFRYVYAAILLPLVFVTFWMSTTGFVNGLLALGPALIVILLVFPPSWLSVAPLRATRLRFRSV